MLKLSFATLLLLLNIISPAAANLKQQKKNVVRGNCGRRGCSALLKDLRTRYPDYISSFEKECPRSKIFAMEVGVNDRNARQVWFGCWDAKKDNRTRYGSYLGTLPLPGSEQKFLTPLPNSSPYTQELQQRYSEAIKKAQFKCATKSGSFNILPPEQNNSVQLQCYFQGGVVLIDESNDFKSDGEASKGAGVDEILGTFPVSTKN
ncbi:MAG: hypothetical protein KME64_07250 [Scytonematopsis contorta HA4267-MV1]|jgi:hypothetical protein|nr:hypothetical protein [Scytonematopsis contorta HA4267-MV1]